ncbi:MAG: hypothetical protein JJT78_17955 [Leptospira sp.]|nr:hypothetical protein [Leptospira sp.]
MTETKEFTFHNWKPNEDHSVYDYLNEVFKTKGMESVTSNIYTIAKDLILNGTKANYKRLFFQSVALDINHPADYELGVRMFKSKVLSGSLPDFESLAVEMDLWVKAEFLILEDCLHLRVTNNQAMVAPEIQKIRNSFLHATDYVDIMEFYLERADDSEGEGIGIALVIILLKFLGVPLNLFTIENSAGYTIANIQFPWSCLVKTQNMKKNF